MNHSKSLNSVVFVTVKNRLEFSERQLIKDDGFIKMGKEVYETRIIPYNPLVKTIKVMETNSENKLCLNSKENPMECKICLVN